VYVSEGSQGFLPPADVNRCIAAQTTDFRAELPDIPANLQAASTSMLDKQLRSERGIDARPPRVGVWLVALKTAGGGGGGGGADAALIDQHGMWGSTGGGTGANPGVTLFSGVLPDGVATVTLHYPAGKVGGFSRLTAPAVTIKANVVNNVVVVSVPRAGDQATEAVTTTWLAANGTTIKTLHGQP
jgi:hypothetical protein